MDQILSLMAEKVQVSRRKKRLLITGGAGFIGLNFLQNSKILENYDVCAIYKSKRPSINKNVVFIKADLTNSPFIVLLDFSFSSVSIIAL